MLKIREIKEYMKPKIGFTGAKRESILDDLNFAIENGFNYYEIQAAEDKSNGLNLKTIKRAKKIAKENNISLNLHASYFKPLCGVGPKTSEEVILANKIGVKQITIHGGELIENLKKLITLAKKYKIKIGLENSFTSQKPCRTPEDLLRVVNSVKGLGITFDIGHANLINLNPIKYFKKVKAFVIDIHLHDNNGKSDQHAVIGKGNINFNGFIKECKKANYYGPFIFEVFPHKNVLKCREKFLNIWNQI